MGGSPQTNGRLQGYIPGIMKWQFFWVGAEKARLFIGRTARAAAVLHEAALSGTRALQLRNAREARGGKKKSSRDEHGVLAGPQRGLIVLFSKVYI